MKRTSFSQEEMEAFRPSEKIGLISCVNPDNEVHVSLITSIMASSSNQLTLGQFCMGRSKWFIQQNNRLSFLIMTLDRKFWRGKSRWTHKRTDGPEYEVYNEMPMFRYNSYFGINTVHYLDLLEVEGPVPLPLGKIVPAALATRIVKQTWKTSNNNRVLKPFAENLFNDLGSLKFISYLAEDGFPRLIPIIQCQASDSRRLVFASLPFSDELKTIPIDSTVAVYCMNMSMQSVLIRGKFRGFDRKWGIDAGSIDIAWVYNSMPPLNDQIYPEVALSPIETF